MTPILSVAAAVLAIAVGQSTGSPGRNAGEAPVAPGGEPTPTEAQPPTSGSRDTSWEPGVPYLPSPGDESLAERRGAFLNVALQSTLRAQTLQLGNGSTSVGADLEVTPGIALDVESPVLGLSLGYAPRFTIPLRSGVPELAILNRATLHANWRADPLWTVSASGIFTWGDYSQLAPATTPGGAGPPPPTLDPVRSFETYPYIGIETLLAVQRTLSPRDRVRLGGGYFDVGGVGTIGEANQPRTWGPLAEAAYAWEASRASTLTTGATFQQWFFVDDPGLFIVTLTETWRQAWTSDLDTTLSAGPGYSNRDVDGPTGAHHLVVVGSLRLDYHPTSRHPVVLSLVGALAPYVDVYLHSASEQLTFRGSFDWHPSAAWQIGASLAVAMSNYSPSSPGSYGTAGASANFAATRFLVLSVGGYSQAQFRSGAAATGPFSQWSLYFSLSLLDRIALSD